jgi:hypothetical protein
MPQLLDAVIRNFYRDAVVKKNEGTPSTKKARLTCGYLIVMSAFGRKQTFGRVDESFIHALT